MRSCAAAASVKPLFVNGRRPEEVWVLYRDEDGFTRPCRVADMGRVRAFLAAGAKRGHLWMEGQFEDGDPLRSSGGPRNGALSAARARSRG
jgi:hypothetical protein